MSEFWPLIAVLWYGSGVALATCWMWLARRSNQRQHPTWGPFLASDFDRTMAWTFGGLIGPVNIIPLLVGLYWEVTKS